MFTVSSRSFAIVTMACLILGKADKVSAQAQRDPFLWPYSQHSIWNQPIGSSANYHWLGLPAVGQNRTDWEYLSQTTLSTPQRNATFNGTNLSLYMLDNDPVFTVSGDDRNTNGIVAIEQPDGYVYQLNYGNRPNVGGDISGIPFGWSWFNSWAYADVFSDGYYGSHGGSGLSGMGGSIRAWELRSADDYAIQHAVKIELDTNLLWRNSSAPAQSYVWPARTADSDTSSYGAYKNDPALAMGSLLALSSSASASQLGIRTSYGRKLFHALQDYGAYVVDTSGTNYKNNGNFIMSLCAERASRDVFDLDTQGDFLHDLSAMTQNLYAVVNNTSSSIGGGGNSRRALAPPFATVRNGTYKVVSANSGKDLDVGGASTADGASVIQWHDNGGANQRWNLAWVEGTAFTLTNVNSGKLLDVNGGSTADLAGIVQWYADGSSAEQWQTIDAGNGYYVLRNANSGKNLDVYGGSTSDGAQVIQYHDNGGMNQHWSLTAP